MPTSQVSIANPLSVASAGTTPTMSGGAYGEGLASELLGRYADQTRRGLVFSATNQAAQAVTVALATAYTGLCLSNPIGNTKNLHILGASYALSVAPAAIASLHIIGGYSATAAVAHTAALTAPGAQNMLLGTGPASTAKVDTSATTVNPGYVVPFMGGFTAGAFPATGPAVVDIGGSLIVPPGGWVAIGALTAVTGFGFFLWAEHPVAV